MYTCLCATVAYWALVSATPVDFQYVTLSSATSLDQYTTQSSTGPVLGNGGTALIVLAGLLPALVFLCLVYHAVKRRSGNLGKFFFSGLDFLRTDLEANTGSRRPQQAINTTVFNLKSKMKYQNIDKQKPLAKAALSAAPVSIPARVFLPKNDHISGHYSLSKSYQLPLSTKRESESTHVSTPPTATPRLPPGLFDDTNSRTNGAEAI